MSARIPVSADDEPEDRPLPAWLKVALFGGGSICFTVSILAFTGQINLFSWMHNKPETQQQPAVIKTAAAPLTNKPTLDPHPGFTGRNTGGQNSQRAGTDARLAAYRKEMADHGISAFAGESTIGNGFTTPPAGGTPDPAASDKLSPLETSLTPTRFKGTRVAELPDPTYTIAHGRVLQCKNLTMVDSTLMGGVTAELEGEVKSDTGTTVVLDKGATVFGTIENALVNGAAKLSVVWQSIDTDILYDDSSLPHRYTIDVDSPASGALGDTGMDGDVNRHLPLKIGGILGYSAVQGAMQYAIAKAQGSGQGNTSVNLNSFQTGGNSAADKLLGAWVDIPDVMTRNPGGHCGIFVMRLLDMRGAVAFRQKYHSRKS